MLKIMVYNRHSWKVLWILFALGKCRFWKLDELIARHSEAQTGCPVTYTYTKRTIQKLLNNGGEVIIAKKFYDHIFSWSIQEYVNYTYKKVWYFRLLPSWFFRCLERIAGWHLCVEGRLK